MKWLRLYYCIFPTVMLLKQVTAAVKPELHSHIHKRKRITSEEQIFVTKRKLLQKILFVGMTVIRKAAKEKTSE
jgi:hypothetical protein